MSAMFMSQIIIISILILGLIIVRVLCHVNNCDFAETGG
jgi:hypothetical protein